MSTNIKEMMSTLTVESYQRIFLINQKEKHIFNIHYDKNWKVYITNYVPIIEVPEDMLQKFVS